MRFHEIRYQLNCDYTAALGVSYVPDTDFPIGKRRKAHVLHLFLLQELFHSSYYNANSGYPEDVAAIPFFLVKVESPVNVIAAASRGWRRLSYNSTAIVIRLANGSGHCKAVVSGKAAALTVKYLDRIGCPTAYIILFQNADNSFGDTYRIYELGPQKV
jgi:hypothetical protein